MPEQQTTTAGWKWPRLEGAGQAGGPLLAGAVVTGVLFDLAVRSGTAALGAAATIWALVATVLAVRQTRNRWAIACFAGAAALAACLVLRASPWLAQPDLAAIALLLALGTLLGEDGNPFDVRWSALGRRAVALLLRLVWVPGWLLRPFAALVGRVSRRRRSDAVAAVWGLAIALPIAVTLGLLLGSADPVFASFFSGGGAGLDPGDLTGHLFLVATGALLLGAVAAGLSMAYPAPAAGRPRLHGRQALVVMVAIDALFALFAIAQADVALGGAADALRSAGVTPAEYARSGFFQLLWVAGLTWIVSLAVRGAFPPEPGPLRGALVASVEVAIGLVLLILAVAHARLQLYEVAFGFTMLRLYSHVFAGALAAAFVLLGASVAGAGRSRNWLFGAVGALALAVLLCLDAVNPEAVVVRLNVERAQQTGRLDAEYLATLSDDAVPVVLSATPALGHDQEAAARAAICGQQPYPQTGWESFNVAVRIGSDARQRTCGP